MRHGPQAMALDRSARMPNALTKSLPVIRRLGRTDYETTWRAMRSFTDARVAETPDEFWITEHPPTYTLGLATRSVHLPRSHADIAVVQTDRGGQITYHGPGQLVLYPLLDLRRLNLTVRALVQTLEAAVIDSLGEDNIVAYADQKRPGVYVNDAKIAALGLKIRAGCCYHGLSLNVDMELAPFDDIDPCGYPGLPVTSVRNLGHTTTLETFGERIVRHLRNRLYR